MIRSIRCAALLAVLTVACSDGGPQDTASVDQATTQADTTMPPAIERQRVRLMKAASPAAWARTTAVSTKLKMALTSERPGDPLTLATGLARESFADLGSIGDGDIMALAFIVLMQASADADSDLKSIMAGVKSITAAKQHQRDLLGKVQADAAANATNATGTLRFPSNGCFANLAACLALAAPRDSDTAFTVALAKRFTSPASTIPTSLASLDATVDAIKSQLDSLGEMGEMESLRLQMAMDRLSKLMTALSNTLKKIEDTQDSIVADMK